VIISTDGIVLTNNHVIANADEIVVGLSDKRKLKAKVVGRDPKSDIAVLKLKGAKDLTPIRLGDSSKMRLGDIVLAVGNPFGVGQTVTMGIVSAKGRANVGIVDYEDFIQTDAAINPGNSGGALVNLRGELIGINTAILSRTGGYQGISFAIPTNMAKPIMDSLVAHGKVVRGWLGVAIQEVTPELAKALKLSNERGVLISDVDPRGPAKRADLRRGDLGLKLDGQPVDSVSALRNRIAAAGAKASIRLDVVRDGRARVVAVKLAELPTHLGGTHEDPSSLGHGFGLRLGSITKKSRSQYRIPDRLSSGVVIESVAPGSAGAQAGLRPGDVILEVNQVRIDEVRRFSQLYKAARGRVLLLVYRDGSTSYLLLSKK
jgi:serine protease Do